MAEVTRPKILLIKPVLPYPPNQGTKVASFGLIKALRDEFDVTVLSRLLSRDEQSDARELENWCDRVVTVMAPNRLSVWHRAAYKVLYSIKSVMMRRSLKSLYDCPGKFVNAARRLAKEDFDLVIIEYWQLFSVFHLFPQSKRVLLTHDIDMLVNREVSLLERHLFRKLSAVRRWLVEQREEIAAYRLAGRVWTLTERDRAAVERICRGRCAVDILPHGIDVEFLSPPGMQRNRGEVLFMGFMGASFNIDALGYFVTKIYPHFDGLDGVSITIVGGGLPQELEYFGLQQDVEVVGRVPDVRPYLHRASCMVVPLRFGGGLRIRILEAMAAGLPVVCSEVAIAGMPFEPDVDFLLANEPEDYARQIERLLNDDELGRRLAASAREKVRRLYAEDVQRQNTVALVRDILATSVSP